MELFSVHGDYVIVKDGERHWHVYFGGEQVACRRTRRDAIAYAMMARAGFPDSGLPAWAVHS